MRAQVALFLVLTLLAAPAAAAPRGEPVVTDPADREDAAADLRALWLDVEEAGLRFTIEVTSAPRAAPDHLYFVHFEVDDEFLFAAVGFTGDGTLRGYIGSPNGGAWNRGGFENAANDRVVDRTFEPGTPARVSGVIPWDAVEGLHAEATLNDLFAGTTLYHRTESGANPWMGSWGGGWWEGGHDHAEADAPVELRPPRFALLGGAMLTPAGSAASWTLGFGALGGLLGGAGALAYVRRSPPGQP